MNEPVLVCGACAYEADMPDEPDWAQMISSGTTWAVSRHPVIVHHADESHDFMWDPDQT